MSDINRQTIIFFLPLEMEAFTSDQNPYSSTSNGEVTWDRRQLYMNPQQITLREKKYVKSDLTKGGFVVQYWGEELPVLEISGTTGSSGIEGINVLRDIYRHEQTHYRSVLAKRQRELAQAAAEAAAEAAKSLESRDGLGGTLLNIGDTLTGGALTDTINGVSNAVDIITSAASGSSGVARSSFSTTPTLAAFATNIDMYYQGQFYRGYFTNFTTTESASDLGMFTYQFGFVVTRMTGRRENFMPWHREAVGYDGETVMSEKSTVSKGEYPGDIGLTFSSTETSVHGLWEGLPLTPENAIGAPGVSSSEFTENQFDENSPSISPDETRPVNRNTSITGE